MKFQFLNAFLLIAFVQPKAYLIETETNNQQEIRQTLGKEHKRWNGRIPKNIDGTVDYNFLGNLFNGVKNVVEHVVPHVGNAAKGVIDHVSPQVGDFVSQGIDAASNIAKSLLPKTIEELADKAVLFAPELNKQDIINLWKAMKQLKEIPPVLESMVPMVKKAREMEAKAKTFLPQMKKFAAFDTDEIINGMKFLPDGEIKDVVKHWGNWVKRVLNPMIRIVEGKTKNDKQENEKKNKGQNGGNGNNDRKRKNGGK